MKNRFEGIFYGWWIVGAAILIQTLQIGLLAQGYGVYIPVLQAEFGWSTTLLAAAFSLLQAVSGLLGPVQGWLLVRYGPRTIMRVGMLLFGLAFLAFSQVTSLWGFFITFSFLALGYSLGGFLSLSTTVVNWFERKRSTALAFMQLGVSLGGFALPLVAWSLAAYGWRTTAFASGVLVLVLGLPLTQVMRREPEAYGLQPDGAAQEPAALPESQPREESPPRTPRSFTAREALRTRAFWLLACGHALALLIVAAVNVHAVIHLNKGLGYSLPAAAGFIALMTAFTIVGQLLGGVLGDRFPKRILAMIAMWLHAAALLLLTYATSSSMVLWFALGHGVAWGVRGPLMQALRADYFGRQAFASIMGYSFLIAMFGTIGGPLIAGYFADVYGSYQLGFSLLAGMAAVGSVCFWFAKEPCS